LKAVEIRAFGSPDGLAVIDLPDPSPADGQVLIATEAIGGGGGVSPSRVGQRVWAFTGLGGGYVKQAIAPVEEILPLPANLSPVDAVTLGSSGVVAHFGLTHSQYARGMIWREEG
jgi:NADPH:quinone reductase-like Zn-dependent oxidoreductase